MARSCGMREFEDEVGCVGTGIRDMEPIRQIERTAILDYSSTTEDKSHYIKYHTRTSPTNQSDVTSTTNYTSILQCGYIQKSRHDWKQKKMPVK